MPDLQGNPWNLINNVEDFSNLKSVEFLHCIL